MARTYHRTSLFHAAASGGRLAFMDRIDPRARIIVALLLSLSIAAAHHVETLAGALVLAVAAVPLTTLRARVVLRRLVPVNLFAVLLLASASWTMGMGSDVPREAQVGDGLSLALLLALKANAMVLWVIVLLGTLDFITFGHALRHLRVPAKLVHLLLFTVRYIDVLHGEYLRLRMAMKVRGFRPRVSWHTYRSFGYLVGMLLVRSLDRSERILAAMKCRGFRGQFHLLDHFSFSVRDVWFGIVAGVVLAALVLGERL
jgi:cobalt/nickel transport system permease protein